MLPGKLRRVIINELEPPPAIGNKYLLHDSLGTTYYIKNEKDIGKHIMDILKEEDPKSISLSYIKDGDKHSKD